MIAAARALVPVGLGLAGILSTAVVHSSVLLGAAWLLTRSVRRGPRFEELVWRAALLGTVASVTFATVHLPGGTPWGHRFVYRLPAPRPTAPPLPSQPQSGPFDGPGAAGARRPVRPSARTGENGSGRRAEASASPAVSGPLAAPAPAATPAPPEGTHGVEPRSTSRAGRLEWARVTSALPGWAGWLAALGIAWALGALLLLARGLAGWLLFRRLLGRRKPAGGRAIRLLKELRREAGIDRPVTLSVSREVRSPLALPHREICVPPRFQTELSPVEQRAVLAHELAHLARRDLGWAYWIRVVRLAVFVQPLAGHAERRLALLAEVNADDWAVRWSPADALARSLGAIAEWCVGGTPGAPAGVTALASEARHLPHRVRRLLDRVPPGVEGPQKGAMLASLTLLLAVGLSVPSLVLRSEPESVSLRGAPEGPAGRAARLRPGSGRQGPAVAALGSAPSLDEGWSRASRRAAKLGVRQVVVRYRLPPAAAAEGGAGPDGLGGTVGPVRIDPERIRIRARAPEGGAGAGDLEAVDLSRGREAGEAMPRVGAVLDLGVVQPDSSARWLRDQIASFAREGADPGVQMRFVEALGAHPGFVAEAYLVRLAWIHPVTAIRWRAVELLADHRSPHAFGELALMLRRNPEPGVAQRALAAVARYPAARALPVLRRAAAERTDPAVRAEAAEWVRKLGAAGG